MFYYFNMHLLMLLLQADILLSALLLLVMLNYNVYESGYCSSSQFRGKSDLQWWDYSAGPGVGDVASVTAKNQPCVLPT